MKIKPEHYAHLKTCIDALNKEVIARHRETVRKSGEYVDLEKRVRWDCLWAAVPSRWLVDNLYDYINDTHVDSALKSIMRELGLLPEAPNAELDKGE